MMVKAGRNNRANSARLAADKPYLVHVWTWGVVLNAATGESLWSSPPRAPRTFGDVHKTHTSRLNRLPETTGHIRCLPRKKTPLLRNYSTQWSIGPYVRATCEHCGMIE